MNKINISNNKFVCSNEKLKVHNNFDPKLDFQNNSNLKQPIEPNCSSYVEIEIPKGLSQRKEKNIRFAEPVATKVINVPRLSKRHIRDLFYTGDEILRFIEDYRIYNILQKTINKKNPESSTILQKNVNMKNSSNANNGSSYYLKEFHKKEDIVFDFIDDAISYFSVGVTTYIESNLKSSVNLNDKSTDKNNDDVDLCEMIYLY